MDSPIASQCGTTSTTGGDGDVSIGDLLNEVSHSTVLCLNQRIHSASSVSSMVEPIRYIFHFRCSRTKLCSAKMYVYHRN